jgi:hypothetical protein
MIDRLKSLRSHPGFDALLEYLSIQQEQVVSKLLKCSPDDLPRLQGQHEAYGGLVQFFNVELPLLVQQQEAEGPVNDNPDKLFRRSI